ncbi:hypothetical protein D6833_10615 [Candidatus Parcubacteria bacterium]|nr:MAG: hypothetical protein D6833_10615 [Candidatus Parcubacteria bacterium]
MAPRKDHITYEKSPRWKVFFEDGRLVVTQGADAVYMLEELSSEDARRVYEAYCQGTLHKLLSSQAAGDEVRRAIRELERAGVVYKKIAERRPAERLPFSVQWVGKPSRSIAGLLEQFAKGSTALSLESEVSRARLVVFVRTSAKLAEVMGEYRTLRVPHLLVDIGYHHTVSLGPFVFPRETACLGCFVGRITRYWGDPEPPPAPRVGENSALIASLIIAQVRTFQERGSCPALIEQVCAFDLADLTAKKENVFRLPWCPICYPDHPREGLGSFELPWRPRGSQI